MIGEIPLFHAICQLIFCLVALPMILFDSTLLLTTIASRKDPNTPFAYIIVMSTCGIFGKFAYFVDFATYVALPMNIYTRFRENMGREFTILGSCAYYVTLSVGVLMTFNRLFVVVRPLNTRVFSRRRIFMYSFLILMSCMTILLIPYFSTCPVNFHAGDLRYKPDCDPDEHFITTLTNRYSSFIVVALVVINSISVVYPKLSRWLRTSSVSTVANATSLSLTENQKRRERMLLRQAIGITVFLSFYEFGKFMEKNFTETYNGMPRPIREGYFYLRYGPYLFINFFVYYLESVTTRKMMRKYWKMDEPVEGSGGGGVWKMWKTSQVDTKPILISALITRLLITRDIE